MNSTRRAFVLRSATMAAALAAASVSTHQAVLGRAAQTEELAFSHYDIEVGWDKDAFVLFNSYAADDPILDMIALNSTGTQHSGSLGFWLGETEWNGLDDVTTYLEEDEKLNFLDGTTIIRAHSDSNRDGASLLFLPEWEGEIDTYGYWEIRKVGQADNEWAHIKLDGTLSELDPDDLHQRLETVTYDGDPVFQVTDLDDVVDMLTDLRDEYLG